MNEKLLGTMLLGFSGVFESVTSWPTSTEPCPWLLMVLKGTLKVRAADAEPVLEICGIVSSYLATV